MKRKNKRKKKPNAQSLSSSKPQHDGNTIKDDKCQKNNVEVNESAVYKDDEIMEKVCSVQDVVEDEHVTDISYKEHLVLVGIGIVFCIILYMASFLV
ncbi:MAG: hypothetical protein ACUZ8H_15140 [Candidatus Anammoxibacter sp.]